MCTDDVVYDDGIPQRKRADHRRDLGRPRRMADLRWALTLTFTRLARSFDESQKKNKKKTEKSRKEKMRLFVFRF
jgi:hypothetical protein